jgi:regulatory protein
MENIDGVSDQRVSDKSDQPRRHAAGCLHAISSADREASADADASLESGQRSACLKRLGCLLARREYASDEMRRRLIRAGFDEGTAQEAVSSACAAGLIDDRRFATLFIRSKVEAGWGQLKIERELAQRGIEAATLPGYPDAYLSAADELVRARNCIEGYRGNARNRRAALYGRLMAKGFTSEVCAAALRGYYREST